jgi:hypothetical protein
MIVTSTRLRQVKATKELVASTVRQRSDRSSSERINGEVSPFLFGKMDEQDAEYHNDQIQHFYFNILIPVPRIFYCFVQ